MKHRALVFALAMAGLAAPVQAQNIQGMGILALDPVNDGNTVLTVGGKSVVTRKADAALFTAGVTTTGATAEEALLANSAKMQAVLAAARRLGIADRDIQTSQVSIVPVMDNERDPFGYNAMAIDVAAAAVADAADAAAFEVEAAATPMPKTPQIVGYRAANSAVLKQRRLDRFGSVIDALVKAGANTVEGPNFMLEDSASAEEEARAGAIADARKRAEFYAATAGLRVVRIIMIDEGRTSGLSSSGGSFGFSEAMLFDVADSATPVASGELAITGSIGVMFELAPQ